MAGGVSWRDLSEMARRLPGVTEGTSYGTPALRVKKRFLARLKEDGCTLAIRVDFMERDVYLALDPETFFLTDHYRPYPAMLVRLERVPRDLLSEILEQAWRSQAPPSLLRDGDARRSRKK